MHKLSKIVLMGGHQTDHTVSIAVDKQTANMSWDPLPGVFQNITFLEPVSPFTDVQQLYATPEHNVSIIETAMESASLQEVSPQVGTVRRRALPTAIPYPVEIQAVATQMTDGTPDMMPLPRRHVPEAPLIDLQHKHVSPQMETR